MEKTIRQRMARALTGRRLTAKDLSSELGIMEKDVPAHLEHVIKSTSRELRFITFPSRCRECGFLFKKRTRLRTPSKCPLCKSEEISETEYMLEPIEHGGSI